MEPGEKLAKHMDYPGDQQRNDHSCSKIQDYHSGTGKAGIIDLGMILVCTEISKICHADIMFEQQIKNRVQGKISCQVE